MKVVGYVSLLEFALALTLVDANEGYFLWCHSSWSLKAEGYLNLLLTHSQYSVVPGASHQSTALKRTGPEQSFTYIMPRKVMRKFP